jgi:hypothetical protein
MLTAGATDGRCVRRGTEARLREFKCVTVNVTPCGWSENVSFAPSPAVPSADGTAGVNLQADIYDRLHQRCQARVRTIHIHGAKQKFQRDEHNIIAFD